MKIRIVNPLLLYNRGGAEINDLNLGREFRGLGHEASHITCVDPRRPPERLPTDTPVERVSMTYYYRRLEQLGLLASKVVRNIFFARAVGRIMRQQRQALESADLVLLTGKPRMTRLKAAVPGLLVHSVRGRTAPRNYPALQRADGLIFWGGSERDHPESFLSTVRHIVLFPAVETQTFFPAPAKPELRAELQGGLGPDVPVVVFVGRLDNVNRVDRIIDAAKAVRDQGHAFRLVIVGDGNRRQALEAQAREALGDAVSFMGLCGRERVADVLRASDVFVMFPEWNNHPIALMEAVATGIYAIAPRTGRIPDIMGPKPFGEIVPVNETEAFIQALASVLAQKAYAQRPRNGASTRRLSSWQDNAEHIVAFAERTREAMRAGV